MTIKDFKFRFGSELTRARRVLNAPLIYLHNRWVCPSDRVIIKHPDCPRGRYRDADTVLLYAMFQVLVDFVETECGNHYFNQPHSHFETFSQKVYRVIQDLPVFHYLLPPLRNARRGLHYLRWCMKLTDHPGQAQFGCDVFELYRFWKHERPARVEPFDGGEQFTEERRNMEPGHYLDFSPEYSAFLKQAGEIEDKYIEEDTRMLTQLVKIRGGLWT
jgi:hypothetical protein